MTASEHNTSSDSLEHFIHPPLRAEPEYRETTTVRNPFCDLPGIPEGAFRVDLFYTQATFRAELLNPQSIRRPATHRGNPHRPPPRCIGTSHRRLGQSALRVNIGS